MKTCKNILLSVLLLFSLSSCSDWFEVTPENEISKEDLFSTYDGFRTALNGSTEIFPGSLFTEIIFRGDSSVS